MMFIKIQECISNPTLRNLFFILVLSFAATSLAASGVFGGKYFLHARGNKLLPDIDSGLLGVGIALLATAIFINPFYSLWKRRLLNCEQITGLEEFHWEQARAAIERYAEEAPTILAVRAGDDALTEDQKQDFQKSRLAADVLLKAREF